MSDIVRMSAVEPVLYGVVKITWSDGYEGVVDLRPVLATGEIFGFLREQPQRFKEVGLADYGHTIFWLDDDGDEVDFGAESLRRRAEAQAELHRRAG